MRLQFSVFVIAMLTLAPATAARAQQEQPAPPENVTLTTDDGVQLTITYYASTAGEEAPTVVMLPDYKGNRATFAPLAQRLQSPEPDSGQPSFAVVTVDPRGHGDSTRQIFGDGSEAEIDAAKMKQNDFLAMVALDMKAVRRFLVTKNDEGDLNLNKLCLVGAGLGANVAANWAAIDWSWPPLAVGKQGQDVKALVLVSPRWKDHGLSMQDVFRPGPFKNEFKQYVAWFLIFGAENDRVRYDCGRIFKQLEKYHPEAASAEPGHTTDLMQLGWATGLQGDALLSQVGTPLYDHIVDFLVKNVAEQDFRWISRRDRL